MIFSREERVEHVGKACTLWTLYTLYTFYTAKTRKVQYMNIKLHEISVRDLVSGYADSGDEGVVGYGGRLDISPAYQREFIYRDRQREAVVDSVMHGFPLNVMYWAKRGDGTFEVMDGQQRTISLCQYAAGDFSYDLRFFANLTDAERGRYLGNPLMVYVCEGTDEEKLRWFSYSVGLALQQVRRGAARPKGT